MKVLVNFLLSHYNTYRMRCLLGNPHLRFGDKQIGLALLHAADCQMHRTINRFKMRLRSLLTFLRLRKPTLWEQMVKTYSRPCKPNHSLISQEMHDRLYPNESTYAEDHEYGRGHHRSGF